MSRTDEKMRRMSAQLATIRPIIYERKNRRPSTGRLLRLLVREVIPMLLWHYGSPPSRLHAFSVVLKKS